LPGLWGGFDGAMNISVLLKRKDITSSEKLVLMAIKEDKSLKISEYAEKIGINPSTVSRVLQGCKRKKLLKIKNPGVGKRLEYDICYGNDQEVEVP
jgi:DNA-binding MarR family transcriptional regulator